MRSQLFKSLIAIAVASTLTACASNNRDTMDDTASVDTSMSGSATMDQVGTASTSVDSTGAVASTSTMTDSSQMATSTSTELDSTASSQMGTSASGQTGTSAPQPAKVSPGTRHQQMTGGSMAGTSSHPEPYPKSTVATGNIHDRSATAVTQQQQVASQADTSASQQQYAGSTQAGTAAAGQDMSSSTQSTASTGQVDSSQTHASTMSGQTSMESHISPAGAMKTEIVEGTQMGTSTGGMTASSMDQQAVCGMYARLKSAVSTEEREKVMTEILLNVPRGDSALVDVREQCAS